MTPKDQAHKLAQDLYVQIKQETGYLSKVIEEQNSFSVVISAANEKVKAAFFFGKGGVKSLLQGDMSTPLYKEIRNKYYNADSPVTSVSGTSGKQSKEDEPLTYIGTDESGKGDYFGPLIIAGTGVDSSTAEALRKIGVRDSKQLNDSDISRLYPLILGICKDNYNIITINPPKYNELYAKIKNLNKLLAWGHAKTIENILTKKNYPQAISDKFGDESYIINSLQKLGKQINLHQVTKAERYTAVAAASILARHTFNSWFINSKSKYGFELRKGASKEVEKLAGIIIKERGVDYLSSIAKVHFKTTVSANNLFNQ